MMVPALFFVITIIYSIDHWLDLRHVSDRGAKISAFYKLFYARYPMVLAAVLVFFITDSGGFRNWLIDSIAAAWLPAVFFGLYAVNFFLHKKYFVRGIKEVLIALAVVSAVYCPLLILPQKCSATFPPNYYQIIAYGCICLLNVNLFSYLEKEKDEYYSFKSAYVFVENAKAKKIFLFITVLFLITILVLFFSNKIGIGFVITALLYLMLGQLKNRLSEHPYWRLISDGLLILPAFI